MKIKKSLINLKNYTSNFALDVIWSTSASVIIKLRGFVLIFIISSLAGVGWYGAWALGFSFSTYAKTFSTLMLHEADVRLFPKEEKKTIIEIFIVQFFLVTFLSFGIVLVFLPFTEVFTDIFLKDPVYTRFISYCTLLVPLYSLQALIQDYYRATERIKFFAIISGLFPILEVVCTLTILLITKNVLLALQVFIAIGFLVIFSLFIRIISQVNIRAAFKRKNIVSLQRYLKYSLPLIPGSILFSISSNGDRFFVGFFLGAEMVGVYSAAYALASTISLFITSIWNSLVPKMAKSFDSGSFTAVSRYLRTSIITFLVIAFGIIGGIFIFGEYILTFMIGDRDLVISSNSLLVSLIVAVSLVFYGIARLSSSLLLMNKKTNLIFYISFIVSIVNLIVNIYLIGEIGIVGAAIATLISYAVMLVLFFASIMFRKGNKIILGNMKYRNPN